MPATSLAGNHSDVEWALPTIFVLGIALGLVLSLYFHAFFAIPFITFRLMETRA